MADGYSKDTDQQRTYRAFQSLIAGEDGAIDLAQAALLIASIEYPGLDITHIQAQLDALARRVRIMLALPSPDQLPDLPADVDPLNVLAVMNQVLRSEEGFHGNPEEYYTPDNSFLNKVLENHTGIPVTLALLYIEVGKRVGIRLEGIGLPYHFMVGYKLPDQMIYLDPYTDSSFLTAQQCLERIRLLAKRRIKIHPRWFEPVTHRQLLLRLLNNLKKIYIDREDFPHALNISDFILMLIPDAALELRDRGHIHLQLKHYGRALHDLNTYLELSPQSSDRYEILNQIKSIRRFIAMMN
ncbi:SirB1 family protein [Tengunoibacter tsumagoiensis]|uniref:Protein SirB1 N-terminal domain-containing protein n=1 Tax=Tengunoibacter tsumagoiensis TaxID=2014871 RepID=A0A402A3S5_9CHLR|nr:transglutaminase-like domain-containing protein [Tengunoibacter tsumagoiensis]GCE13696.1 hypothetical protein KTT_35550 [Tengunoibacter tsumagoiensis]